MKTAALYKEFNEKWKQENQTKYIIWLIFYTGSLVPLFLGVIPLLITGINDQTIAGAICGWIIFLAMEVVALILNLDKKKTWKKYLAEHTHDTK